jgi:hypothetical protein
VTTAAGFGSILDDADIIDLSAANPPRDWGAFGFNWNRIDSRRNVRDICQFDPIDIKGC